jgi:PAS domain S-box-containing protein
MVDVLLSIVEIELNGQKCALTIQYDITERKQNERRFQALLESAPDAMVIVNREGNIALVNSQAERLFGYTREELLGQSVEILMPEAFRNRHLSHRAHYLGDPQVRRMGEGPELYALRKDGSRFPAEIALSPIQTEEGLLIASAIRDISDRLAAEMALRESERRLYLLAQNSPDTICIMDLIQQRATYLNRSEFLGYTRSEIEDSGSLLHALHPDDKERVLAHWREAIIDGKLDGIGMIEYRLKDKSGQWQWIQSRETVFATTPEGKIAQVLITLSVITERKQVEQQALELVKEREHVQMLSNFVRDVSHDFRTPLATLTTSLYLMRRVSDPEKRENYIGRTEQQVARLSQLIERSLTMVRLDSQPELEFNRLDVNQLVTIFCTRLSTEAREKGIHLLCSLWDGSLPVRADSEELTLAFIELGHNAIRNTPSGGTITFRTRRQGNQAVIEVQDSGVGILDTDLHHIFERLYRVDPARSSETGGAGLGLAIAKQIIDLHQGNITVESKIGEGSTFRVVLPLSQ